MGLAACFCELHAFSTRPFSAKLLSCSGVLLVMEFDLERLRILVLMTFDLPFAIPRR